ncbi:VOC family protein [Brachybacterium tyrofermentans]|uniref:VOC family protein n=1 Tax=Brachybacterium tyrofermentans TaxID=47848 RepID=UPI003FD0F3F8
MPAPQNSPYISFPNNAAEVLAHWQELFGGTLDITLYDDLPDLSGFPFTPPPGTVAHGTLTGGLLTVAGGDGIGEPGQELPPLESEVYSFLVGLDAVDQAHTLIDTVTAAGGRVAMPFALAPWGDHYGQVVDRYGVMFALVVAGNAESAESAESAEKA